eukprot:3176255-Amphidinium_carterae.1
MRSAQTVLLRNSGCHSHVGMAPSICKGGQPLVPSLWLAIPNICLESHTHRMHLILPRTSQEYQQANRSARHEHKGNHYGQVKHHQKLAPRFKTIECNIHICS